MIENTKKYREWPKEQLIIFCKNKDYIIDTLRDRLFILTGCHNFGNCDGTDGGCVECSINNQNLFDRCILFQSAFRQHILDQNNKKNHNENNNYN